MAYCIYTDQDVAEADGNWDHILGGHDQFCVWSQIDENSKLGSKVDGAIANDPLVAFALRNAGVKGHKGKLKEPVWKRSTIDGEPYQVTWSLDEVKFWDAKSRKLIPEGQMGDVRIESNIVIDRYSSIRFISKVALGGAYFIYGDIIRSAINCQELRELMWLEPESARQDPKWETSGTYICDRFHEDAHNPKSAVYPYKLMTEYTGRSTLIAMPYNDAIAFHVSVAGMYMGSITIMGDTSSLPIDRHDHDLGHVILLAPGDMERAGLRKFASNFYRAQTGDEPPLPDDEHS